MNFRGPSRANSQKLGELPWKCWIIIKYCHSYRENLHWLQMIECVHDVLETYHAVTLDPSAFTILFHLSRRANKSPFLLADFIAHNQIASFKALPLSTIQSHSSSSLQGQVAYACGSQCQGGWNVGMWTYYKHEAPTLWALVKTTYWAASVSSLRLGTQRGHTS